ncbi:inactive protein kinase SELMODRAFT_444075-like isoform X2 [Silene latifolia]|uniref:inactive protein kinase SELMODRAFT_444075-like isoform X2 n=1 Tax=Silene latifolia TaxID=37657 RepID=UPI003D77526E
MNKNKNNSKKVVVVAVKASKEISRNAMEWALTHVVQPGNSVKLLVVISPQSFGKKLWGLQRFTTDCTSGHWKSHTGTLLEQEEDITDSCSQLMHQLCRDHKSCKINVKIKILSGSLDGVVAAEARRDQTDWVILDKLKAEAKHCMDKLQCNVILMKGSNPKVLRLNLTGSREFETDAAHALSSTINAPLLEDRFGFLNNTRVPNVTPTSSPEHETSYAATDAGTSSVSSSDAGMSSYFISGTTEDRRRESSLVASLSDKLADSDFDTDNDSMSSTSFDQPWMQKSQLDGSLKSTAEILSCASSNLQKRFSISESPNHRQTLNSTDVRHAISLAKNAPADPPPLCSICHHKAPVFGRPPQSFTYAELELATNGFSERNFLAEGGFGSVYRGMLQDGQVVAVKQYKLASSQGDKEFCSEVEVLSCAQHRNVVMLIGFCVEGGRRLLVYEYICNGSLDYHLYGRSCHILEWSARQKIAIGAARGLRYLHEECRVGCIVHRDMRPNNILLTHDFEPLVGDFGLARCQPDGGVGEATRVIGTFGYLAPEYAQSGQITEKADVYSFGIVLLELIAGRKAVDINKPRGQQCLTEWARRLLREKDIRKLIDPCLGDSYGKEELCSMLQCASLCIKKDPDLRPRMSQVLRLLESGMLSSVNQT